MDEVEPLRRVFARYVANERLESPVGAIAELVARDELSRDAVDRVLAEYNVTVSGALRDLLDLILDTARVSLSRPSSHRTRTAVLSRTQGLSSHPGRCIL
jgi:hypothetical protein